MQDEHLIFVKADGRLAAMFLIKIVESFDENADLSYR